MSVESDNELDVEETDRTMLEFFNRSVEARSHITGVPREFSVQSEVQQFEVNTRRLEEPVIQPKGDGPRTLAPPKPTVVEIYGNNGNPSGGTSRLIRGTKFIDGCKVKFGVNYATNVEVFSDTLISCIIPANTANISTGAAIVDVKVFNIDNEDDFMGVLTNGFTYFIPPVISTLSPITGPGTGGTVVNIQGSGVIFSSGYTAVFGGVQISAAVIDPGGGGPKFWRVTSPPHPEGLVNITIIAPDYEKQRGTKLGAYTYGTPPGPPVNELPARYEWQVPGGFNGFHNSQIYNFSIIARTSGGAFYNTYNGVISFLLIYAGPDVAGVLIAPSFSNVAVVNGVAQIQVQAFHSITFPPSAVTGFGLRAYDNAGDTIVGDLTGWGLYNF